MKRKVGKSWKTVGASRASTDMSGLTALVPDFPFQPMRKKTQKMSGEFGFHAFVGIVGVAFLTIAEGPWNPRIAMLTMTLC